MEFLFKFLSILEKVSYYLNLFKVKIV